MPMRDLRYTALWSISALLAAVLVALVGANTMITAARPRWLRYRRGHSANAREAANGAKKESQRQDQGKAQEDLAHRGDYPQKNQGFRRSMSASTVIRDRFTFAMVGSGAKTFR